MNELAGHYDDSQALFKPRFVVVQLTDTCNEACAHCVVASSPKRKATATTDHLEAVICDAWMEDVQHICFYGWEPFTRPDELMFWVELALRQQMQAQIMTNGFWWVSDARIEKAFERLDQAHKSGADPYLENHRRWVVLCISTDRFHTKVPPSSIGRIIARWLERPNDDFLHIGLSIWWPSDEVWDILNQILDAYEKESWSVTAGYVDRGQFIWSGIFFLTDEEISISEDDEIENITKSILDAWFVPHYARHTFEEGLFETFDQLLQYCEQFGIVRFIWGDTERLWKVRWYKDKSIGMSGWYDFKLVGAWEELLWDDHIKEQVILQRSKADWSIRDHERTSTLVVGMDGKVFLTPSQMYYDIHPFDSITQAKYALRGGDPIARCIIHQDPTSVIEAAKKIWMEKKAKELERLHKEWLSFEALYFGLKIPGVVDAILEDPKNREDWPEIQEKLGVTEDDEDWY